MTIEEEKTEFTFQELNPAAQQRAIERYAMSLDSSWYEHIYEDWGQRLREAGFLTSTINFSGFNSQGDGASFSSQFRYYGDEIDKWLSEESKAKIIAQRVAWKMDGYNPGTLILGGEIENAPSTPHHMGMSISEWDLYFYHSTPESEEFLNEICEAFKETPILEHARDLAQEIYQDLEKEYEYLTSAENVAESSDANDWHYNEFGELL
jgi:hypothetical protein